MHDVTVCHRTSYYYQRPVRLQQHRLMLRPRDSHDLRLAHASLAITPRPLATRWAHDVFGNSVCLLEWERAQTTDSLEIVSNLRLHHFPAGSGSPRATLDAKAEALPFDYRPIELPDLAALRETNDPDDVVGTWARRFLSATGRTPTLALLETITRSIHAEFRYEARDEEGTQSPAETLARGAGACRDFALLMIEAARALGLAARFVSGYLYRPDGQALRGGGATHAWCSVYLPGAGWLEYDPTNGSAAGDNMIRVAVTRMPEQAVPVGGDFIGSTTDFLAMEVDVQVALTPEDAVPSAS